MKEQWKRLWAELELMKQAQAFISEKLPGSDKVHLVEGRTIFQSGRSMYSRAPDLRARLHTSLVSVKRRTLQSIRENDCSMK